MTTRRHLLGHIAAGLGAGALGVHAVSRNDNRPDDVARCRRRLLQTSIVSPADIGPVLYTWTTDEQAHRLRAASPPTLASLFETISASGQTAFDRSVARLDAGARGDINAVSGSQRRFAWPNPWATVAGWNPRGQADYGVHLVRMVLRDDAVLGELDSPSAIAHALPRPPALGAIYHRIRGAYRGDQLAFAREVVVLGPGALASWSMGTAEIRDRLVDDAALLEALARIAPPGKAARPLSRWGQAMDRGAWSGHAPLTTMRSAYEANLAMASDNVAPTPAQLLRTASLLRRALAHQGPPLEATGRQACPVIYREVY